MKTKVQFIKDIDKDIKYLEEAAEIIKNGGIGAFPTETVYGLGANALDGEAVKKIFVAKGRPQDNPLIIHIADKKDIDKYVAEIPKYAQELMDKFWPGPLTIILKKKDIVSDVTSAGLDTVGVRMPNDEIALKLIELSGVPIAAPSANISGRPSPTDIERCEEDLNGRVDFIIGAKKSEIGVESTIVDATGDNLCVLRPGGITLEMLKDIDEGVYIDKAILTTLDKDIKPKAPGMKYKHYAPKAKVRMVQGPINKMVEKIKEIVHNYIDEDLKVGIMATDETISMYDEGIVKSLGTREDLTSVTKNLFEMLRAFDDLGVDVIITEAFEEKDLGVAIMNRLKKSCGFDITIV
ncbi:threonylcarbamoyl-AMP synthase [Clostridium perfringens]|uniref:L-threonylcarbamoyladenylate synthase n=1 Tax=Clostridium perfringens TaxID=1502 RepID=UPI0013E40788|nr:L-threonylcarbamoyladenylate synthase [Clostridium perfringens]NGT57054.1 threonylcarbamoyl-AMP synthase [Clostridium perfringens]NGT95155.1 threonylcarbamoyl-AMP synthase [Clostridium perfringens]